jgi:site-specific DNA recombinase
LPCQKCGRHLVGVSAHGRGGVYQYYACPGKFKYGECELENLPRERIEASILSQIERIFEDSQLISRILQRVNTNRMEKVPKKQAELKSTESQILQKRAIMRKYLFGFESGALQARTLNKRVEEIENGIALLEKRKRQLEGEINRSKIQPVTIEVVRKVIGRLEEVILSASPSEKKSIHQEYHKNYQSSF